MSGMMKVAKFTEPERSVFSPAGSNPTTGNIFHLPPSSVYQVDIPAEELMKSIFACSA